jgi:enterobactin synthetase component D
LAVATAVAKDSRHQGLGVDIEHVASEDEYGSILDVVATSHERDVLAKLQFEGSPQLTTTIVFSAKESFYKSVYPQVGHFLEFSVLQLEGLDFSSGIAWMRLRETLSNALVRGQQVGIKFDLLRSGAVLTHYLY